MTLAGSKSGHLHATLYFGHRVGPVIGSVLIYSMGVTLIVPTP